MGRLPGVREVGGLVWDTEVFATQLELHTTVVIGHVPTRAPCPDSVLESGFPGSSHPDLGHFLGQNY